MPRTSQPAVERAAPADLDHVAESLRIGRLADDAMVEFFAAARPASQHLDGAVDGGAFLVAGDEKADRALFGAPCLAIQAKAAAAKAAMPPFMSAAPRPKISPSMISPAKGSTRHWAGSPGGTTSVWPAKSRNGAVVADAGVEIVDIRRALSEKGRRWVAKPAAFSRA